MYNYFPLPTNMRDFSAVVTLRIEEGAAGFGVYVLILSILRDMPDYKVADDAKRLAFTLNERDTDLVQRVTHNYGLFDFDEDGLMFSPWLNEQMEAYDAKKKKLQEAGRRGAAKRFGSPVPNDEGQAIATPSGGEGQAIAILHNVTQQNVTKSNITQASREEWREICLNQGKAVDDELFNLMVETQQEGHAVGYLAQLCRTYGMGENVLFFLQKLTDNANLANDTYKRLVAIVRKVEAEKYPLKLPANFFLSKLLG